MRIILSAVAVSAMLLLAGCSGATTTPSPPAAGTCLDSQSGQDADWTSTVDCTEPHLYDVVGSAVWPGIDDAIAEGDAGDLFDTISSGKASTEYLTWAYSECSGLFRTAIGADAFNFGGKDAAALDLYPGGNYFVDYSLGSRDAFVAGQHDTLCSAAWVDATNTQQVPVAFDKGVTLADFFTPAFPASTRACYTYGASSTDNADCPKPHKGEFLAFFDGVAAVGADWVSSVDPSTGLAPDYTAPDAFCNAIVSTLYPAIAQSDTWYAFTDIDPSSDAWSKYDGTVDPTSEYSMFCAIVPYTGTLLAGDVIDGSATVVAE